MDFEAPNRVYLYSVSSSINIIELSDIKILDVVINSMTALLCSLQDDGALATICSISSPDWIVLAENLTPLQADRLYKGS